MSTSIPADLRRALGRAATADHLLVASDYDGCIAPLVSRPEDAVPDPTAIAAIESAATLTDTAAAVVSGRELAVLAELSGLRTPVHLVGSHGSEFDTGFAIEITPERRHLLARLVDELRRIAADHPGTTVETKPASTTLHVRNAEPDVAADALELVRGGPAGWDGVQVTEGKAVIELAVIETSKGHALDTLRERTGSDVVIYLGDDVTDEKAFGHLRPDAGDLGIKVGDGETAAAFRVGDTTDVATVLTEIVTARRDFLAARG